MLNRFIKKEHWLIHCLFLSIVSALMYFGIQNALLTHPSAPVNQTAAVVTGTNPIVYTVSTQTELRDAIVAAQGGETILLNPGNYGALWIENGPYNKLKVGALGGKSPTLTAPVTIASADINNRAIIENIEMREASYWHFKNLSFRPLERIAAIKTTNGGNNAIIGCDISYGDSQDWTATEWGKVGTAISLAGNNNEVGYNYIKNVSLGITVGGAYVHHNIIDGFAADGMRAWDDSVIEHNIIKNPIGIDDNHTDGFQSFVISGGTGVVKNVTLRNNTIIDSTFDTPLRTTMQGIGLFDGYYENWVIENNLVVVDHWHGISLYGSRNSTIRNNVVLDPNTASPGPAWVRFFAHKNGDLTVNGVMQNNYSAATPQGSGYGVTSSGNVQVPFADYDKYFVDYRNFDYTIKPEALPFTVGASINSSLLAPEPIVGKSSNGTTTNANTNTGTSTGGGTTTPPPTTTDDGWTYCATENTQCAFSGTKQVRYGENGVYFIKTFTDGVMCNNATFGDPLKTVKKHCDTSPVSGGVNPIPTLALSASPTTITEGQTTALTWDSTDATSCTASGDWSGTKDSSGSANSDALSAGTHTFTLTCTGSGGTVTKTVSVTAEAVVIVPDGFMIGDRVTTTDIVRVRSFSGLASKALGKRQAGDMGTITKGPQTYDAYTWWYVDFDTGLDGWVAGSYLKE